MSNEVSILLVDPQYDFFPGGSLAVTSGNEIIKPIVDLLDAHRFTPIFASADWHPASTVHFRARGGIWPPHCIQETHGAEFHMALKITERYNFKAIVKKGFDENDSGGYSAFDGRMGPDMKWTLHEELNVFGTGHLIVAGLATDYCVKNTVLDALKLGYQVMLFTPGIRAVDLNPGDGDKAIEEMQKAGARLLS